MPMKSYAPTPRQQVVLDLLRQEPGASIQAVAAGLGLSHTAAAYSLRLLQRKGLIEGTRHGRSVRHYLPGASNGIHRLGPILRDAGRARVLEHLRGSSPAGISINRLATHLGLSFGIVKSTLVELDSLGLVRLEVTQGRYRVHRTSALDSLLNSLPLAVGEAGHLDAEPPIGSGGTLILRNSQDSF